MRNTDGMPRLLFETSWEVCNKIGGIYTVLSTKAKALQELSKDTTIFIGPDVWNDANPSPYFKEHKSLLRSAQSKLQLPHGITIRTGRWDLPGQPLVVLVSFDSIYPLLPQFYGKMWERYGVDSLHAYGDYSEGCAFGIASAFVIKALTDYLKVPAADVTAHFDEWTTAMGLLELQQIQPESATLFTTHATSIGRSICGNGKPLYDYFAGYHGDQMADELNMQSKHSLEKNAAHAADCFTTVSRVTAAECCQLLDIDPQVVTPNGFEDDFVPGKTKYASLRKKARARLMQVASALTGKQYPADTLLLATSGRNEYRNKGIDLFIDSINSLRDSHYSGRPILAFILVPAWVAAPRKGLIERLAGNADAPLDSRFATHTLHNEYSDAIFSRLTSLNVNLDSDKVDFIFVPCYLDGHDGVIDITYYDLLPALDLTIFPSYYEPWGYTPLESIAFGVPTISTDKAGFGQWILDDFDATFSACGAEVVERTDSNYHTACADIARKVEQVAHLSSREAANVADAALRSARAARWQLFIKHYLTAFDVAAKRCSARLGKRAHIFLLPEYNLDNSINYEIASKQH